MATRVNNSNPAAGKEKKVTPSSSSSNSRIPQKPTNIRQTTASSAGKPLRNYLKPASSSRSSEPLRTLAKKTNNDDANQKVLRRRSFDHPPSSVRQQNSPVSLERKLGTRSSSFSSRTPNCAPKPNLDRNSRSTKPVKPQAPGILKKSSSFTRTTNLSKNSINNAHSDSSKSPSDPHDTTQPNLDIETKQESDKESNSVQEAEEIPNIVELQVQSDTQEPESKEDVETVQDTQTEDSEDAIVKPDEISIIAEELSLLKEIHVDNNENELHDVEEDKNIWEGEEKHTTEEGIPDEIKDEIDKEDKGEENASANEKEASCEEHAEEKNSEGIKEVVETTVETKEAEDIIIEEENSEKEANNEVEKRQEGQGKKETPTAYNDVIEETKNKLLEKRKNKVKALVGAFQTVIDYETAASNK